MQSLAQQLEQVAGLGIFLLAAVLATLSLLAWRRERDRRMLVVGVAYLLFSVHGFIVFAEYYLLDGDFLTFQQVELLEHGSSFLILAGLLAFFVAITSE